MEKHLQNESEIVGLIIKVQERLASLENKVDILVNRILPKPAEAKPLPKPFQQPVTTHAQNGGRQDNRYRERVMHKAICADCKKECEVPFKPNGDRPVYCKECFSRRKAGNPFKASLDTSPKETVPTPVATIDKPQASEKKKPAVKKKSPEKKKPVAKKGKKK